MRVIVICMVACAAASLTLASQATYLSSGGVVTLSTDFAVAGSTLSSPAGTVSLSCPVTPHAPGQYAQLWSCIGGSFNLQSNDGTTSINASFTTGTLTLTASGGGRGHPTTYFYSFVANFAGTLTVNGQSQAILGSTSQSVAPRQSHLGTGTIGTATTAVSSRHEPTYVADTYNNRIVRVDDILGSNWQSLGTGGAGVKQFATPWGVAVDSAGRIYVSDTGNCRIVRVDNIGGKNWTSYGTCGAGTGQFSAPAGLTTDALGRIYVADSGNNRIVQIHDMSGTAWISLGTAGSGVNQFGSPPGVAVDAAGKIYITDQGNSRVVRVDNMAGTNWVALGTSGSGTNQFSSPAGITTDASARIYVVDANNNRVVRMDDMTGLNWTVLGGQFGGAVNQFINPFGVSVDSAGGIYVADTHDMRIVRSFDMTGLGWTSLGSGALGPVVGSFNTPYGVFAKLPATPVPVVLWSARNFVFPDEVVGVASPSQTATLTNIGGATLGILSTAITGDFSQTNTCPTSVIGGESCTYTITFQPTGTGTRKGALTLNLANGATASISLAGVGSLVSVSALSVDFGQVTSGDGTKTLPVTVTNPMKTAAGMSSITIAAVGGTGAFTQTNNCLPSVAAGTSCTVNVTFAPANIAIYSGILEITDGSGTTQNVNLTGTGVSF